MAVVRGPASASPYGMGCTVSRPNDRDGLQGKRVRLLSGFVYTSSGYAAEPKAEASSSSVPALPVWQQLPQPGLCVGAAGAPRMLARTGGVCGGSCRTV